MSERLRLVAQVTVFVAAAVMTFAVTIPMVNGAIDELEAAFNAEAGKSNGASAFAVVALVMLLFLRPFAGKR